MCRATSSSTRRSRAARYEDTALPIGFSQTISQPYIVARMTEALIEGGRKLDKVLEVGTGCGYQTAVLAPLVKKIYSIERIAPLAKRAKATLKELGIKNVMLKHGDGTVGWKSQKPFDGILVAAAPLAVPEALFAQLANRGRLVVPVGPEGAQQLHPIHAIRRAAGARGVRARGLRSHAGRHGLNLRYPREFE